MSGLNVHGFGHFHPPTVIDNAFLEDLDIGTTKGWINEHLGILERRTVFSLDYIKTTRNEDVRASAEASDISNVDASEAAARMAMELAGISAADLDLVVSGSSCAVHLSPPEAFLLADRLGIAPMCADINASCNTFLTQASLAMPFLQSRPSRFALLVQCEIMTRSVDYRARTNACLMGDCATAVVVSAHEGAPFVLEHMFVDSVPSLWKSAVIPAQGHFRQNGPDVRRFATERLGDGIQSGTTDFVIFHQANLRILDKVAQRLRLSRDQHLYNVDYFGNCGSAGGPSVFSQNWALLMQSDRDVQFSAVGAGLSYGSARMLRRTED